MLSLIQRGLTFALVLLTATLAGSAWHLGGGWPGVLAAICVVPLGYAGALLAEFAMMHIVNRADPAPRPTLGQLLVAWAGEVASGPMVFGWRQPWRSARWPDRLTLTERAPARPSSGLDRAPRRSNESAAYGGERGQRGLLLVHGFVCSRGLWNPWLARLSSMGVPFVAVDLEPVHGSIDDYLPIIEKAVRQLEAATQAAPVIVAHSMGGLAVRCWWSQPGNSGRAHHLVTIGTPHQGTWLARFAFTENGRQMRAGGRWLRQLERNEAVDGASWAGRATCFYGHCDNIVFPASNATLPGADNRHLAGVAHVHMADRAEPFDCVRSLLEATPH